MQAHRIETVLSEDGVVTLRDIPFHRGENVEIIILPASTIPNRTSRYPLRGQPISYAMPTATVADGTWEAAG